MSDSFLEKRAKQEVKKMETRELILSMFSGLDSLRATMLEKDKAKTEEEKATYLADVDSSIKALDLLDSEIIERE